MSRLFKPFSRMASTSTGGALSHRHPLEDKLGLLREADVFRDLADEQMRRVEQMTVMSQIPRGQTIYAAGEMDEALFVLKRGKVQIFRLDPEGKKLIVSTVDAGTLFGEMTFTGQRMLGGYAEALEDSTLCVLSRHDVEALILEYPSIGIQLLRMLSERLRELETRLEEASLRDIPSRVAAALLRMADRQGPVVALTHQELADTVGTHRETVTRALGEFRDRGLIGLQRHHVQIRDMQGLQAIAEAGHGARTPRV